MEKKNTSRIIREYLSNRFSPEMEERIQKWIIQENGSAEKEKASFEYWNELDIEANSDTYLALKRTNRKIGYLKTPFFSKTARIAAALIPLFFIIGGYLYYTSNQNRLIEISTAYGETKQILLPDSSEIWINAGTTVKYLKTFSSKERVVQLDGEAYFAVKKDSSKPFIVQTNQLSVKVLGTKFNVKSYSTDKNITTTLTTGKVEVSTLSKDSRVLKPNEQLTYNRSTSKIEIVEIPAAETSNWITGNLIFINVSFAEIVRTLERKFDIAIEYRDSTYASKLYTVKFLKGENQNEVLKILGDIVGFTYEVKNDKVIIH